MLARSALRLAGPRAQWMGSRVKRSTFQLRQASALVVAEHDNNALNPATLSAVTAAGQVASEVGGMGIGEDDAGRPPPEIFPSPQVSVLVLGNGSESVAEACAGIPGVAAVLHADHPAYENWTAENVTSAVAHVQSVKNYSHILALATMAGKNFMGRLGAVMNLAPITDVIGCESEDTFVRPMYAGNAVATVKASDAVKLMTVRPTAFDKSPDTGGSAAIKEAAMPEAPDAGLAKFVSKSESGGGDMPELGAARVVVSGGRGLQEGKHFAMVEELAKKLGGAVGASRAAVDAGFVPNELQVGQTGKVVAPELYIALGISGAIQHLSGMKDSKCIVAINKVPAASHSSTSPPFSLFSLFLFSAVLVYPQDPDAPIFGVADYGLVGDLFTAVPELIEKV
ncbi:unnamed protein product [Chrysoparadoxa australica]